MLYLLRDLCRRNDYRPVWKNISNYHELSINGLHDAEAFFKFMYSDCPDILNNIRHNFLRINIFGDRPKISGNTEILPPLSKTFKTHRPQIYSRRFSLFAASTDVACLELEENEINLVPTEFYPRSRSKTEAGLEQYFENSAVGEEVMEVSDFCKNDVLLRMNVTVFNTKRQEYQAERNENNSFVDLRLTEPPNKLCLIVVLEKHHGAHLDDNELQYWVQNAKRKFSLGVCIIIFTDLFTWNDWLYPRNSTDMEVVAKQTKAHRKCFSPSFVDYSSSSKDVMKNALYGSVPRAVYLLHHNG